MSEALDSNKKFIILYRSAYKADMSKTQFSSYIGLTSDGLDERVNEILLTYGTELPELIESDDILTDEMVYKYESIADAMFDKIKLPTVINVRDEINKTYIITSAQNSTPVHEGFLNTLKKYAEIRNAELIVIPYRYRNPTSIWSNEDKKGDKWHHSLTGYLCDKHTKLCDGLQMLGDMKIQPTAVHPLSTFDAFTNLDSGIYPHPKIQQKTIATPSKDKPKILMTTGAVTIANYTDSKAGKKGEFHHSLAAVVVEVTDNEYHLRHVHGNNDTGAFYDLDKHYTQDGVTDGCRVEALITGDTHVEFLDETVNQATYVRDDSMVEVLKPKKLVLHDVLDSYARNHHHIGNDIIAVGKHRYGRNNVEEELQHTADFLDRIRRNDMEIVIVKSNHDEAFDKWIAKADPKFDYENCQFFHYTKYHQLRSIKMTDTGFDSHDLFKFWCKNPDEYTGMKDTSNIKFLERDESYMVQDIELGFHGDTGANGSRGSLIGFSKIGPKVVIGHSHSPGIIEGAYQVGLSAKTNLEYANGPSSWSHTHCIVYPDGHRTLINIVNGKWQANN